MQASGLHRGHPAPAFVNHTPRDFQITAHGPSQYPDMFGPYGFGTAPFYTGATMGHSSSVVESDHARKASSSILREHSIHIKNESGELSRPDSFSIHHDCTDQAPYATGDDAEMMTSTSMLPNLPMGNASRDLVFLLRTTGPTAPHRRPSKIQQPGRTMSGPKNALKLLRFGRKKAHTR